MIAPALAWQDAQWQRIVAMHAEGRLPHALLLRGPQGVGKHRFAERLLAAALCEGPDFDTAPCAACRACRLVAAGTHPDLHAVAPLEGKAQIGIDQIRDVIARIALTPQYGGRKAVSVAPAERMTRAAANTLLKTLEEPPGDALFVLVAHRAAALPATIRSRCQILDFPTPERGAASTWLAAELGGTEEAETALRLAHGAPLAARALAAERGIEAREMVLAELAELVGGSGDPVESAERWRDIGLADALAWLQSVVCDLVRLKNGLMAHTLTHSDRADAMQDLARGLDLMGLFRIFDRIVEARRASLGQQNLNEQLLLEGIAIEWRLGGARPTGARSS